ncbi:MAG: glycosyltransferase [Planctomycetes bacterium]|nr:glycosyltransferase [Planctomycetota bacterium]
MRGGERCLEVFCELLPQAHLYTLFHFRGAVSPAIEALPIRTSPLQWVPGLRRWYRHLLPLFPRAIASFDLSGYDLVVSLSHCVAKGAGAGSGVPHVSYCFTPMRYAWDQKEAYFNRDRRSRVALALIERVLEGLRRWDQATHPDRYLAISRCVAERIRRSYGREAEVVHPPVDVARFRPRPEPEGFYLAVSALAPYKRLDLAVAACSRLGRRLIVVGRGEDRGRLEAAAGPSVSFRGWLPDAEVADLMARCRAFLLPGEEDFGIAPLEAMASGRPAVALGRGGALETVVDLRRPEGREPTGVLFDEPTVDSLCGALLELERRESDFDPGALRRHAERFSLPRFRDEVARALVGFARERVTAARPAGPPAPEGLESSWPRSV